MSADLVATFRVDGADLYYTVRGSGPPILLLPSGGGDAHYADSLLRYLSPTHTVLTYDRRGQSRTTVTEPQRRVTIGRHAEDVIALVEHIVDEPVTVFGCSTGAVIGLEFVRRAPSLAKIVVAHEPPLRVFATKAERLRYDAVHRDVRRLHQEEGWQAAVRVMRAAFGDPADTSGVEDDVAWEPPSRRTLMNVRAFLMTEAIETWRYHLDHEAWDALGSGPTAIVPTVGEATGTVSFASRCAAILAETIGSPLVKLPGGHEGFLTHPRMFATRLMDVLASEEFTTDGKR